MYPPCPIPPFIPFFFLFLLFAHSPVMFPALSAPPIHLNSRHDRSLHGRPFPYSFSPLAFPNPGHVQLQMWWSCSRAIPRLAAMLFCSLTFHYITCHRRNCFVYQLSITAAQLSSRRPQTRRIHQLFLVGSAASQRSPTASAVITSVFSFLPQSVQLIVLRTNPLDTTQRQTRELYC